MQQHVKILAILHIIFGGLGVVVGLIAMLFFGGLASFLGMTDHSTDTFFASGVLGLIGVVIMVVVVVISLPGLIAGIGLLTYQPWARILTIVLSAIELPAFPFHTMLGIYGLWVLLSNEGSALFNQAALRPAR
ncbi:MAG TPA: hypothetical protein VNX18_03925 [Bryobacteraceae bacterium]|nr:hypothetical protein [Bryobacteraceae bacterium]